jgi:hypothetical protein
MPTMMMAAGAYCMNPSEKHFPRRSGKVTAPSRDPISRVFFPKRMKAARMPRPMFSTVSQTSPIP